MPEAGVNIGYAVATLVAMATFCVHTFVGGRYAARPLLADTGLPRASRWLNYMTWHMITVLLAIMAGALGWASFGGEGATQVVVLLLIMSAALSAVAVLTAIKGGIQPWRFPASYLFLIIIACGLWGLGAQS